MAGTNDNKGQIPLPMISRMIPLDMPGVDINIKSANGRNPVWFAACNENELLLQRLLDMGAESLEADAEDTLPEEHTTRELADRIRDTQDLGMGDLMFSVDRDRDKSTPSKQAAQ